MLRSMTAFASAERATPHGVLGCELRAVNHRFLELGLRIPDELRVLEPALRERIGARVMRGKLDLVLRLKPAEAGAALQVDAGAIARLSQLARELDGEFPNLSTTFTGLLQLPGVLQVSSPDPQALQDDVLTLVDAVLEQFLRAREREGAKLAAVMRERVEAIARIATEVRTLMPLIREGQRAKLQARLASLQTGEPSTIDSSRFEPGRMEQELALWLTKLDVDEELDRLDSHVVELRRVLGQKEVAGRRLDFLLQEFNREANTLGSKSVDTRTSNAAVELKVLIDQIREQVQNIE